MRKRSWIGTASCLLLLGCSTPYQEMGFSGGVSAQQITKETFRIVSRGNAYTDRTAIQDYVLLKAAETTKQNGATHFALITAQDASRVSYDTAYGRGWASTSATVKPGEDAYIRIFMLPSGQPTPQGAFSADEIIQFTGTRVKRPS